MSTLYVLVLDGTEDDRHPICTVASEYKMKSLACVIIAIFLLHQSFFHIICR